MMDDRVDHAKNRGMLPPPPPPPPPRAPTSSRFAFSARAVGIALSVALALACLALDRWLGLVRLPTPSTSSSSSSAVLGRAKKTNAKAIRHNRSSDNNASHEPSLPSSSPGTLSNRSSADQGEDEHGDEPNINQQQKEEEPSASASALAPPPPATLVCQFSGEMGNNLDKYAHCHVVAQLLLRRHRLKTSIVIRHQDSGKWVHGARDLQRCVPFFRPMDFAGANSAAFDRLRETQLARLGRNVSDVLVNLLVTSTPQLAASGAPLDDALALFANLVERSRRGDPPFVRSNVTDTYDGAHANGTTYGSDVRVPFLFVSWMTSIDAYVDEFVDDFRRMFAFDAASLPSSAASNGTNSRDACCNLLPYEDETVFVR
jgi:hypothetical protein